MDEDDLFGASCTMIWEEQYQAWVLARSDEHSDVPARLVVRATRNAARKGGSLNSESDWRWVTDSLADPKRRWFTAAVFDTRSAPEWLAKSLLVAGINERNPSSNRYLIEPAVKALGPRYVYQELLRYLRDGTAAEKAGAASAEYWVRDQRNDPDLPAVLAAFRDELLLQFVRSEDVDVRRRIVPRLSMKAAHYSPAVAPLIAQAIEIARKSTDEYIRHRIEVQLGLSGPLKPIPTTTP